MSWLISDDIGSKARSLKTLQSLQVNVPNFVVVPTTEFSRLVAYSYETINKLHAAEETEASILSYWQEQISKTDLDDTFHKHLEESLSTLKGERFSVRSSADLEDLPDLSFAGQYDSFLDIPRNEIPEYIKKVWASFFSVRARSYRRNHKVSGTGAMAVIIQEYVPSDFAGVLFTQHPDTFEKIYYVNYQIGTAERLVDGTANAFKLLIDPKGSYQDDLNIPKEIVEKLRINASNIEFHFNHPMDIEWCVLGDKLYFLQARPITVLGSDAMIPPEILKMPLLYGASVGNRWVTGTIKKLKRPLDPFPKGSILVCEDTNPEWESAMGKATALITDHGAKTSHAALTCRELGIPAVVGTLSATTDLRDGQTVIVDATRGEIGLVYDT